MVVPCHWFDLTSGKEPFKRERWAFQRVSGGKDQEIYGSRKGRLQQQCDNHCSTNHSAYFIAKCLHFGTFESTQKILAVAFHLISCRPFLDRTISLPLILHPLQPLLIQNALSFSLSRTHANWHSFFTAFPAGPEIAAKRMRVVHLSRLM